MIFSPLPFGKSVEGHDIEAYKTDIKGKNFLYLLAGTHGDEVEGVYALKELFLWLQEEHSLKEYPIIVIPNLNPDGYRRGTRVNAHGVDLNRNYPTSDWTNVARKERYNPGPEALSEPENKFLLKLFEKYPPKFILTLHSWKPLINFGAHSEDVARFIAERNDYPISPDIGYPTPGSLGTYIMEKYPDSGIITYEFPPLDSGKTLKEIWAENEKALKELLIDENFIERFTP